MDGDGPRNLAKPVDMCKMSPYERQRIRDAWLSVPKTAPVPKMEVPTLVRRTPFGLSIPALRAKCSPHTEVLAMAKDPNPRIHFITKTERELMKEMDKDELKWLKRKSTPLVPAGIRKGALAAKVTPRLETMALAKLRVIKEIVGEPKKPKKKSLPSHFPLQGPPRLPKPKTPRVCGCAESIKRKFFDSEELAKSSLNLLNDTKKIFFQKLNQAQRNSINRRIKEHYNIFNSNYPPEADKIYVIEGGAVVHASCSSKATEKGKRLRYLCELNKAQRRNFRRRMKQMGLPKKAFLPDQGPDRGPKKKIKEMEPWLTIMSQPKYNALSEKPYNPYKVKSSAKFYVPTERILIMAKHREVPPPPPLVDFEGNELPPRKEWSYNSRKRIVASQRTIELAVPRFVKKKAADDVKEDPFAVPRRALTAFCSARTRELAEPHRR